MRFKNKTIVGEESELRRLESEYRMLGFYVKRNPGSITVFSRRPQKPAKRSAYKGKARPNRTKR